MHRHIATTGKYVCAISSAVLWCSVRSIRDVAYAASNTTIAAPALGTPITSVINLFLALAVVVTLAVLTIRFLAKRSNVTQKGTIQVVAARQLAPNRSVQVVEFEGKRWLVGVGDQVTLLAVLIDESDDDEVFDGETLSGNPTTFGSVFADALKNVRARYGAKRGDEEGMSNDA